MKKKQTAAASIIPVLQEADASATEAYNAIANTRLEGTVDELRQLQREAAFLAREASTLVGALFTRIEMAEREDALRKLREVVS